MNVIDWWGHQRKANSRFLTTVDAGGLYDLLTDRLTDLP
jgi:hypothetical protein